MKMKLRNLFLALFFASLLAFLPALEAKEGVVQCANLIYGGTETSKCFSDEFLSSVQRETTIATERHFKSVKLSTDELFTFPFAMMTGENEFHLASKERENLKKYLENGGFLLASAGCSSKKFDGSFRREIKAVFGDNAMKRIDMAHPLFRTVKEIKALMLSHQDAPPYLEGVELNGKMVLIYSPHGLNDTAHTQGCCCCGGNELSNSLEVNVNILVYALLH